jgi:hypothetical protein
MGDPESTEGRDELWARAERSMRRGDLAEATRLFELVATRFPGDGAAAARLSQLRENLQPLELMHPKARLAAAEAPTGLTHEQEGERLFGEGDFAGAAAAYRKALEQHPDSELIRERLMELFALAKGSAPGPEDLLRGLLSRIRDRGSRA